ncbi:hypothetical protein ACFU9X_14360 [Streptomyces atratus]
MRSATVRGTRRRGGRGLGRGFGGEAVERQIEVAVEEIPVGVQAVQAARGGRDSQ